MNATRSGVAAMRAVLAVLAVAACTRPLAPAETGFLARLGAPAVDVARVRVHPGLVTVTQSFPVPPRVTCRSRLYPPTRKRTGIGAAPAMALRNTVFIRSDWARPDMTGAWPEALDLETAMLLLHEMVHVWQWQERTRTGYTPWRAAREHIGNPDPYLFDPGTRAEFASFGYEQQGAIAEEYLCCRVLAPDAERTGRLHRMLAQVFPLSRVDEPLARRVLLPWRGVELQGICD